MRMLDLFSGIGGISLAADWAGIETVAFCEIEPFPQKVLRKNWPEVPIFEDVTKLSKQTLTEAGVIDDDRSIDIICGGYPCQPFSNAGKRQGQADDRHLWPEMFRLVRELRPTWVVGENVAGHISLGLDDVLADLESEGYQTRAFVLPAAAVGAPHRRDRVFIVGYSKHNGYSSTAIRGSLNPSGHDYQERKEAASEPKGASQSGNCKTLAHTPNEGLQKRRQPRIATAGTEERTGMEPEFERCSESMADTDSKRKSQSEGPIQNFGRRVIDSSKDVAHTGSTGWEERHTSSKSNRSGYSSGSINERGATRTTQSRMGRNSSRIPTWMDGGRINGAAEETRSREVLRILQEKTGTQSIQWKIGRHGEIPSPEILQSRMLVQGANEGKSEYISDQEKSGEIERDILREMRIKGEVTDPSYRWESREQRNLEYYDIVRILSHEMALGTWKKAAEETVGLQNLWRACTEIGYVPETLSTLQEIWQSLSDQKKNWVVVRASGRIPWPAGYGQEQYEWEPPRVAVGVKDRVGKLKGLGNAVVPHQIYPIFAAIVTIWSQLR